MTRPAATNIATQHLLDRVPATVPVIRISTNVFACAESDVQSIRQLLGDNKQVLRYLDRGIRASESLLNSDGAKCWVLHKTGAPSTALFANHFAERVPSGLEKASEGGVSPDIFRGSLRNAAANSACGLLEGRYFLHTAEWHEHLTQSGQPTVINPNVLKRTMHEGPYSPVMTYMAFGQTPIGSRSTYVFPVPPGERSWITGAELVSSTPYEYAIGKFSSQVPDSTVDLAVQAILTPIPSAPVQLQTNLVVIAGPAILDHAEFYPNGFAVIIVSMANMSDAIRDVVLTGDPSGSKSVDVLKSLDDMNAKGDNLIIAYKGGVGLKPAQFIPRSYGLKGEFDPTSIGGLTASEIQAEWGSGSWSFSATTSSSAGSFATMVLAGAGNVTVKASGLSNVHIDDGEGILDVEIESAAFILSAVRRAARPVTFVEDPLNVPGGAIPWITMSGFNLSGYNALKVIAASDGAETVAPAGLEGQLDSIGESLAISSMMKPVYKKGEGGLIAALMTPEYFWSGVNR